jgi:hypothetical protein
MTKIYTQLNLLQNLNSNAVSALLLESTRDISVILNRIAANLWWDRQLVSLFIKNDDIGLTQGLLYTTNTTQTFHIFIFSSILMLQLIPITLIMVWVSISSHPCFANFYPRMEWGTN